MPTTPTTQPYKLYVQGTPGSGMFAIDRLANPVAGYREVTSQEALALAQEHANIWGEATRRRNAGENITSGLNGLGDSNAWFNDIKTRIGDPGESYAASFTDPITGEVLHNVSQSTINEITKRKADLDAGLIRQISPGMFVPTGSAADKLNAGINNGTVSPTDPNAQMNASMQGNNVNAPGITPVAPGAAPATTGGMPGAGGAGTGGDLLPNSTQQIDLGGQNITVGSPNTDAVRQIQQRLGIQVDGQFGPKTLEAVKKFQQSHGLNPDGIVGPKTIAALNTLPNQSTAGAMAGINNGANSGTTGEGDIGDVSTGDPVIDKLLSQLKNASPQKTFTEVYKQIYDDLGLSTIKEQIASYTKDLTALRDKKNEEIMDINANPWFTEGKRVMELRKLDAKYEGKESNLLEQIKLNEAMYDDGRQEAQFAAGQMMDQANKTAALNEDIIFKAIDIAEKRADAEYKLQQERIKNSGSGGDGSSGIKYTPTQKQTLTQAGIDITDDDTATYFLNTPKDFQDMVARERARLTKKEPMTLEKIMEKYDFWYNFIYLPSKAPKKSTSSSKREL